MFTCYLFFYYFVKRELDEVKIGKNINKKNIIFKLKFDSKLVRWWGWFNIIGKEF